MSRFENLPKSLAYRRRAIKTLWADLLDHYHGLLHDEFGVNIFHPYGAGGWGIAFPTPDPCRAVKVTVDPTEGPIWKFLMDEGYTDRYHGIAICEGVWRLPIPTRKQDAVLILREDIRPVRYEYHNRQQWQEDYDYRERYEAQCALLRLQDAARDLLGHVATKQREDAYWVAVGNLSAHPPSCAISEFLEEIFREHDIVMADVHAGNIGYRTCDDERRGKYASDLEWVIFDPGHSSLPHDFQERISVHPEARHLLRGLPVLEPSS